MASFLRRSKNESSSSNNGPAGGRSLQPPNGERGKLLENIKTKELIRTIPRKEWIERAHRSEASLRIDDVLSSRKSFGNIGKLKAEMFDEIYDKMGDEMLPEDMKRALVVKTERYHAITVAMLCIVTLGVFLCFRPRDDEAIVVLTKRERVLMYKVERIGFFENFYVVWQMLRNSVIIFGLAVLLPQLLVMVLGTEVVQSEGFQVEEARKWVETEVIERITQNLFLQVIVVTLTTLWISFWCWTKLPHDYGDRHRQSHAANKICASQWSLSGGNMFRQARLRLFFGVYPNRTALDSRMNLVGSSAVGPIPKEDLSTTSSMNPFVGKSNTGMMAIILILLYIFVAIDAVMTYGYAPSQWVNDVKEMEKFCWDDSYNTAGKCTLSECQKWSEQYESTRFDRFCQHINYFTDTTSPSDKSNCAIYDRTVPCCGGCTLGAWQEIANTKAVQIFGMCVSLIADVLTLLVSFAAATAVFARTDEKDHVDIKFAKRLNYLKSVSNFNLTQPLAVDFLYTMFDAAFHDESGQRTVAVTPGMMEAYQQRAKEAEGARTSARPDLRRAKRYDRLDGGSEQDANFQDVTQFDIDDRAYDWEEFFKRDKKSLVAKGANRWVPKVIIPRHCFGIPQDEQIIAAWVEKIQLTWVLISPYLLACLVVWILLLAAPDDVNTYTKLPFFSDDHVGKVLSATLIASILLIVSVFCVFAYLFVAVKHVVVLTDVRVIYARLVDKSSLCCVWAPQLRLDIFRHDHNATYGSMVTTPLSLYMRATQAPWTPGSVMIQPGFYGVLKLTRNYGNVLNVYQMVCQLTKPAKPIIGEREIKDCGVSWEIIKRYVDDNMERVLGDVWKITHLQPDDLAHMMPNVYLTGGTEVPVFYWSFKEFGWVSSPVNVNTDIIITTNRVYLYKRAIYKNFDGKTCCCFGACWCICCRRCLEGPKRLERSSSFVTLPFLLSFATEVNISPPVWSDPVRWPIKCPCLDTCCEWCTLCCTCRLCKGERVVCNTTTCSCLPSRAGARAQLQIMWRHRYNATQEDLMAKIRPYHLQDPSLVADCLYHMGLGRESVEVEDTVEGEVPDYEKVEMLRKIMGVVQDMASLDDVRPT